MKNYYQILGIKPNATDDEIKRSYRVLAKKYHPDVNPGDASAASKFADINEANAVLSDPQQRAEYDAKLREANAPHPSQEEIIARQRAQAQEAARQAAFRTMNMSGMNTRARVQAQAQAQAAMAQAQVQAMVNQAYKKGADDASAQFRAEIQQLKASLAKMTAETKKIKELQDSESELKRKLATAERDRRELEQELFSRDRENSLEKTRIKELEDALDAQNTNRRAKNEIQELKAELDKTKKTVLEMERELSALRAEKEAIENERDSLAETCSRLERDNKQFDLKNSAQIRLQQDKRRQLQEEIEALRKQVEELTAELDAARAENEQWVQYAQSEDFLSDTEKRIEAWNKKTNKDKRLAKPTLYGDLGVLIWATDEEIKDAYNKLIKRYSGKAGDAIAAKLKSVEDAFAVLGNPKKRKEYNATIDITEERIAEERRLIAENEKIMEEYRSQLANREFWQRFDELTAAAMEGDAESQFTLGSMYYSGEEIDSDYEQAVFWFKEAAKQKHPDAMYYLGCCYVDGIGMEKNENTGQSFIRQAAKLGSKPAQKAIKN